MRKSTTSCEAIFEASINETCTAWMETQLESSNELENEIVAPNNILTTLAAIGSVTEEVFVIIFIVFASLILTCIVTKYCHACYSRFKRHVVKPILPTTIERENDGRINFQRDPPPYKPMPLPAYSELFPDSAKQKF
ncbi:Oidioi.mRNA.OKI2018_I69.PAR.g11000.t1.cds [Oikopleura dioica]|uniref:Oidioi.mRNA.OKI2018_I69.PAR.g11000.t1.cds n=1 Tax=Oikopleura dioica TaxID=34765 RepID=A0ABN7RTG7_OIKDI|nr:Oidioi.mRNA.OKI2018_I69.PAR.g11000.t1.cds [Oikopleura dioica]